MTKQRLRDIFEQICIFTFNQVMFGVKALLTAFALFYGLNAYDNGDNWTAVCFLIAATVIYTEFNITCRKSVEPDNEEKERI